MVNTSMKITLILFIISVLGMYLSFENLESLWITRIRHTFHGHIENEQRKGEPAINVKWITSEEINGSKPVESRALKSQSTICHTSDVSTSFKFLTESASTVNNSPPRSLKQVKHFKTDILLYSAIVGNSTENNTWDIIAITGWQALSLSKQDYMCCVLFSSRSVNIFPVIFNLKRFTATMQTRQYICALKERQHDDTPVAVTLTEANNSECHREFSEYVDVEYSYRHPEDIAVFAKIIYGKISARDLIVWFEIHKLLGFEKVLMYPYELNRDAMKVFEYYRRQGIVEIVPFVKPGLEHGKRETALGKKNEQGWSNDCVALNDGLERFRGYKYIISLDIDEYLIPKSKPSWKSLLDSLFLSKPNAAGFHFKTYLYINSWSPTNKSSPFEVGRFFNRSDVTADRPKHVFVPARVQYGGFTTHYVFPLPGYKSYAASEDDVAVHHFRSCRPEWLKPTASFPCFNITRHHDETVLKLLRKVEQKVMDIINDIGI